MVIKKSDSSWAPWLIISLFYAYQYVLRVMPSIMLPDIMAQFQIDSAVFGQFSGAYYIGYCLLHIPVGMFLDRYGPRKVTPICILMTAIGLLPVVWTHCWIWPVLGRFLIGVGSSAAILGTFKVIHMTFPEERFTRMLSLSVTIGLLGALYGGIPVGHFCQLYDHRLVTGLIALVGVVFALCSYMLIPDSPKQISKAPWVDLKEVLMNKKAMVVCALAALMVGPMEGFADAWGTEFLKQVYGLDTQRAAYLTSMIYIGMCFAPLLSRIAEKTNSYLGTIAGSGMVMLSVFGLLVCGLGSYHFLAVGLFCVGFCCAYQILAIYKASTYVDGRVAGLTTAVANMIIMSFGYVFHSSIGLVIKLFRSQGGARSFIYGISVIPLTLLIATVAFMVLARFWEKESH
ncbi:MAG: MFS transporter [Alphaproteobacteria bacterium 40-19]|nr:MAG: MFS transporter [Alphaproteobacteria bacterium 40-19]